MAERPPLTPLRWEDLSSLRHRVFDWPRDEGPSVLVVEYSGHYGHGSSGRGDATYVVASATAAWEAWHRDALILDFTNLSYACGDEMEWVLGLGWVAHQKCQRPLALVVGDDCRAALQSLEEGEEPSVLADDFAAALRLIQSASQRFERCLEAWRREHLGG